MKMIIIKSLSLLNMIGRYIGLSVFAVIVILTLVILRHPEDFFFEMKKITNDVLVLEKTGVLQKVINISICLSGVVFFVSLIKILF